MCKGVKIDHTIQEKRNVNGNINEKLEKRIDYYKTLSENIFIVSSSALLVYLFYPYHHNDLLNEFLNNKYGKFIIFIYSFVILATFDWQSFRPTII
jgi:hypothetical protein